jgi:hypothetical protein
MATEVTLNEWSEKIAGAQFMIVQNPVRGLCLQRKSFNRFYYGGYLIHEVCLPSALAREWKSLYSLELKDFPSTQPI